MTYYIGSARHDENGKYVKGRAGDQTEQEVATQKMYNYWSKGGWVCYRFKNPYYASYFKQALLRACSNNHIGYSQSDRYGIIRLGTTTKEDTNCDCSTLIRECIIEGSDHQCDPGDFTTASEGEALEATGLFVKVGKVTKASKLYEGDILVTAKKGHTAGVTTGHSRMDEVINNPKTEVATCRSKGDSYAIQFARVKLSDSTTTKRAKVLQHALNLDYGAGLVEDGIIGPKTIKALGKHYVRYGEKQYLVSAAEIFCYTLGQDPKGFEVPGVYGKGLKAATRNAKLNYAWFLKYAR